MKAHEDLKHLAEFVENKRDPAEPPRLKRLLPQPKPCEDCDLVCERRLWIRQNKSPKPHWRVKCTSCGLWKNPETGKFDLTGREIQNYYSYKSFKAKHSQTEK